MFTGKVMGKTEAEIVAVYPDPETLIFLANDKDGKVVAADVDFGG